MKLAVFALAAVAVLAQDELSKEEQKALNQVAKNLAMRQYCCHRQQLNHPVRQELHTHDCNDIHGTQRWQ